MSDLVTRLRGALDRHFGDRGVGAIAVCDGASARPETVWVPEDLSEEPGFLAYSITKTFTSVLMLLLQQEGRLSLDDSLARWFPRIDAAERILLRQLLNHTAGLPDYGGLRSYHDAVRTNPEEPWSFEKFAAETFDKGLLFEPGAGWAYSNPGYMLLKQIVEEVTGESYAALVADRIARPLELRRTFVTGSLEDLSSLALAPSAALSQDGKLRDTRDVYHPGWVSHGVVASTPSEIAQFFDAVFGGRLLSEPSLREMTTLIPVPVAPPQWRKPSYGLGLMGDPESAWGRVWGHGGAGPGYDTSAYHAPDLGGRAVTVCAMCAVEQELVAEQLVFAAFELVDEA